MDKNYLLTWCILLFATVVVNAQTLNEPQLHFSHACVSESYNTFSVGFSFSEKTFNSDNAFYIELSDAGGNFDETTILAEIGDQNYAFEFDVTVKLPVTVSGSGYKVRMRSTSPELISPVSEAFEAYFVPDTQLILNNYEASSLCASEITLLELNTDVAETYIWYRDGEVFAETREPYLTVDVAGNYYAEPYYGACSGTIFSNIVTVEAMNPFAVSLATPSEVVVCDMQEVILAAEAPDQMMSYQWYHNNSPVEGANSYTLSFTASGATYGTYYLEAINNFGCDSRSEAIEVRPSSNLVLTSTSPLQSVILGNTSAQLSFEVNIPGVQVVWFKDGAEVKRGTDLLSYEAVSEGEYLAEVSVSDGCAQTISSGVFRVFEPISFTSQIGFDQGYTPCESTTASVSLNYLTGHLSNGDAIAVEKALFGSFGFQWLRDGIDTGITDSSLFLEDHMAGGTYTLEVTYKNTVFTTNTVEAHIGLPTAELFQQSALTCDTAALLGVTPVEGAIYNWYLDQILVGSGLESEFYADIAGDYRVEMEYMGCVREVSGITVSSEAASAIQIYPGERVTLIPDEEVELVASGAENYLWSDASGAVLSESDRITVTSEGVYFLKAHIGSCEVEKKVEVYYNLAASIPNVVTPNNDFVNDNWVLPQKLLDDPDLEVIICDSYGNPVLRTMNYQNNWPASASQSALREPNYYYILNRKGRSIQKGVITLVR